MRLIFKSRWKFEYNFWLISLFITLHVISKNAFWSSAQSKSGIKKRISASCAAGEYPVWKISTLWMESNIFDGFEILFNSLILCSQHTQKIQRPKARRFVKSLPTFKYEFSYEIHSKSEFIFCVILESAVLSSRKCFIVPKSFSSFCPEGYAGFSTCLLIYKFC